MSILINKQSKIIVQGMTGSKGTFHTDLMMKFSANVVGGVTPGKGGTKHPTIGSPIFNTVVEAVEATGANCSMVMVPPPFSADAILEAADAGIKVIVAITEGIPINDMVRVFHTVIEKDVTLIGPNCPGIISPEESVVGILPPHIFKKGPVGFVSRSGTLTYEIVNDLTQAGLGQSTCIGIGGDPIIGTTFKDVLPLFEADPETRVIVMVGEIGGSDEQEAAEIFRTMKTPVVGFIGGRNAPPGKRMGHAGAIVSGKGSTAQAKVEALEAAGIPVADTSLQIVELVREKLG